MGINNVKNVYYKCVCIGPAIGKVVKVERLSVWVQLKNALAGGPKKKKKKKNAERKTLPGQHCHQPQSALHLIPATPHKLHFCTQKKNGEIKQQDSDKRRNRKHVHTAIDVMSAYYIILIGK